MRLHRLALPVLVVTVLAFTVPGCVSSGSSEESSRVDAAVNAVQKNDPTATQIAGAEASQAEAQQLFSDNLRVSAQTTADWMHAWKAKSKDGSVYYVRVRYASERRLPGGQPFEGAVVVVYRDGSDSWAAIPYPF